MTNPLRLWPPMACLSLWLLLVMPAQANQCGDPQIYRGGSYHEQPFTLVELGGAKEKQLEQMLKQFSGRWRGDGIDIRCKARGMEKRLFKIEGSGDGDASEAEISLSKKYRNGSSNDVFELFLEEGLLRFNQPNFTNLGLSSLSEDTLEFSIRSGGRNILHSYWRVQFSKKSGRGYKNLKIEKSVYAMDGLVGAERWNLKRF